MPDQQKQVNRGPRIKTMHVRMSTDGIKQIDKIALREDRDRSSAVRLMLRYAVVNMPKGYTGG